MLTPHEIVLQLDKYIIGQDAAKRAVAVALRNRYRRSKLPEDMQNEITPKNILLIGPTGVGKTEIARRLAKLVQAPFVKVEATKFTEVGYVGRDVDSMIRDLVEASVRLVREQKAREVEKQAAEQAENRLVELLVPVRKKQARSNPFEQLFGGGSEEAVEEPAEVERVRTKRDEVRQDLLAGKLEEQMLEIEVEEAQPALEMMGSMGDQNMGDVLGSILPRKKKKRRVTVKEARRILQLQEADKLIDSDDVVQEAITKAEQEGIIFLDEIDKVAGRGAQGSGPDVSREGVQRDILPIVEGSTVNTKYGPVRTDYMLFMAAGAFHVAKVSDLIPELQGRFSIHVQLESLTREDFRNILTQPENALIKQYTALLSADEVKLVFQDDAIDAIAQAAWITNQTGENIGARRLHTIVEALLADISYHAGGHPPVEVVIDEAYCKEHLSDIIQKGDLRKYIL